MPQLPQDLRQFEALLEIIRRLRDPAKGCPWDLKQTHQTLTRYAIEEAAELVDAIETGESEKIVDELGDVLLQVILHSQIGRDEKTFDIFDVIENINKKMIRRHPHVFGDSQERDEEAISKKWREIKKQERGDSSLTAPRALPALMAAEKIGKDTREHFDWNKASEVKEKVVEEFSEVEECIEKGWETKLSDEMGDLLFSIAQWARHLGVDPETALRGTNHRFIRRYNSMIEIMAQDGKKIEELNTEEKENYWSQAKNIVASENGQ